MRTHLRTKTLRTKTLGTIRGWGDRWTCWTTHILRVVILGAGTTACWHLPHIAGITVFVHKCQIEMHLMHIVS